MLGAVVCVVGAVMCVAGLLCTVGAGPLDAAGAVVCVVGALCATGVVCAVDAGGCAACGAAPFGWTTCALLTSAGRELPRSAWGTPG